MTVLEDNVVGGSKKLLSLKKKRKGTFSHQMAPAKKQISEDMLNGYRAPSESLAHQQQNYLGEECPVATLSNMGNTCFLNSVLYSLRFAPTFLHNLHHLVGDLAVVNSRVAQGRVKSASLGRNVGSIAAGASSRSTSSKDLLSLGSSSSNDIIPKPKVQVVTEKLHELFMTMHNLEIKDACKEAYQPVAFLQAVRDANYIFEGNNQQDAHELLIYLFDNIRETCNLLMQFVQHNPDLLNNENEASGGSGNNHQSWISRPSWRKFKKKKKGSKEPINEEHTNGVCVTDTEDADFTVNNKKPITYNFVSEDFEGVTLRRTKCLECECVTERKETFYDISVPILFKPEDLELSPSEVYRRACVTSEKLCDSNKYLCDQCKRYNEASRDVLFERLPNIMVLQLKRFTTTVAGVQKVNSYLPTPLDLECFCETCCQQQEGSIPPHRYQLCCVIMHLGGTMASGHYIAYVKATDHFADYMDCTKDIPKTTLSASSSEKSLSILKYLKPKVIDSKNGLTTTKTNSVMNGLRMCRSMDCCGVKMNKNIVENVINRDQDYWQNDDDENNMWLECDDETVRPICEQELQEVLGYKQNSTSTPYLLFYAKVTEPPVD